MLKPAGRPPAPQVEQGLRSLTETEHGGARRHAQHSLMKADGCNVYLDEDALETIGHDPRGDRDAGTATDLRRVWAPLP